MDDLSVVPSADLLTASLGGVVFLPEGPRRGVVEVRDGLVAEIHARQSRVTRNGPFVLPGLVDIHVHGALGAGFNSPSIFDWLTIIGFHSRSGTTSLLATLASAPWPALRQAIRVGDELLSRRVAGLAGLHIEGPYLSPGYRGAHPASVLRTPEDEVWKSVLAEGRAPALWTLAPELPGAEELIRTLAEAGTVVAAGHSAIGAAELPPAHAAGVSHATHLWSGQSSASRRGDRRVAGLLEAVLASDTLTAEAIADGHHVPAELLRVAYRCLGPDRLCLVSDASSGTGLASGSTFAMGSVRGRVADGVAVAQDGTSFCGSVVTLSEVLRFAVQGAGIPLRDAVRMATRTPARVVRLPSGTGEIRTGLLANIVLLDDDLVATGVVQDGRVVSGVVTSG